MNEPRSSLLGGVVDSIRNSPRGPLIGFGIAVAVITLLVIVLTSGGGSDGGSAAATADSSSSTSTSSAGTTATANGKQLANIELAGSSWTEGQQSLVSYEGYLLVSNRGNGVARIYQQNRDAEVRRQERITKRKREQARQAARRRALAAYREALRQAALERKRQEAELRRKQAEQKRKLAALREKYKVEPGEECTIPEVQAEFDCSTGYPF